MAVELYDEHEQSERVRAWIRENGVAVLMGVALALAGIFGWRQWQDYRANRALLANEYYAAIQREIDAGDAASAAQQWAAMREAVGDHAYVALAGLLLAGQQAAAGEIDAAADTYAKLAADDRLEALQPIVTLRRAQLEIARNAPETALRLLGTDPPAGLDGLWYELRGDALQDLGRSIDAVEAYTEAVERYRGAGNNFRIAQTKLDHARSAAGSTEPS